MADYFKLSDAINLSENPSAKRFKTIIDGCTNTEFFTSSKPINKLSSWVGYYYYTGASITASSNIQTFDYTGGSSTITYTILKTASNGSTTPYNGVTPVVSANIGSVSNISAVNANGVGTCTYTIGNTTDARDITISITFDGYTYNLGLYQNPKDQLTGVSIKSVTVNAGSIKAPVYYYAKGETQTVTSNSGASCDVVLTLTWSSESGGNVTTYTTETTSYSSYGSLSGPSYSWSVDKSYASLSSSNSTTMNVEMDSRGKSEGDKRYATVTRSASYTFTLSSSYGSSSKSGSASCICQIEQEANTVTCTGGTYTYGNVTAGSISNATIPASGGSATATAGNGSQSYSVSDEVCTYKSGESTTTSGWSGSNAVSPSVSSITGSADTKGCTKSDLTTVKSQAVTWNGNGSKSASGTMYVYQQANDVVSTTSISYGNIYGISNKSDTITASGGSVTITFDTGKQDVTSASTTYRSGCTSGGEVTTINVSPYPATCSGSADSLGCTYKSSKTTIKTCTASYSSNGKTDSATATIYQAANTYSTSLVSSSYEDEDCDTDWSYSVSVSGVKASDLDCDGGTSCPYGYSYSATAYWEDTCTVTTTEAEYKRTYSSGCTEYYGGDTSTDTRYDDGSVNMTSYANVSEDCVSAGANSSTSSTYVGDACVTVSYGGDSDSDCASVYQDGCEPEIIETWGPWSADGYFSGDYSLACGECGTIMWNGSKTISRTSNLGNTETKSLTVSGTGTYCYERENMSEPSATAKYGSTVYDSWSISLDSWSC